MNTGGDKYSDICKVKRVGNHDNVGQYLLSKRKTWGQYLK